MIEAFILKWWQVIAGISTLLAGDCILRARAFAYIHNMVADRVEKDSFNRELLSLKEADKKCLSQISCLEEKISLISIQTELIMAKLDAQKESSEVADENLKEIIKLVSKN